MLDNGISTYRLVCRVDAFAHRSSCYQSEKYIQNNNKLKTQFVITVDYTLFL